MNKELPSYYGISPASVRYNNNLTPHARLLYTELTALTNKEGYCWATNKYFAELYNVTPETVSVWISSLALEGHIRTELFSTKTGRGRKIHLKEITKRLLKENHKRHLKENPSHINNTRDNNTSANKLSKDNIETEVSNNTIFGSTSSKKIISYWNKLEGVPRVKTAKRTKTIKGIEVFLKQIKNKSFLRNNTINPICRRKNNIPFDDTVGGFSYKKHFKNLALLYRGEYEPKNKSVLPSSLLGLIYNPMNKSSWLMQVMYNPPKPISEETLIKDTHPKVTDFFLHKLNGNVSNNGMKMKLIYGIRSISEFQKRIPAKTLDVPKLNREFGSLLKLCKNYYDWLYNQDWIEEITTAHINTNGKLWKKFIKEMEEEDCEGYRLQ